MQQPFEEAAYATPVGQMSDISTFSFVSQAHSLLLFLTLCLLPQSAPIPEFTSSSGPVKPRRLNHRCRSATLVLRFTCIKTTLDDARLPHLESQPYLLSPHLAPSSAREVEASSCSSFEADSLVLECAVLKVYSQLAQSYLRLHPPIIPLIRTLLRHHKLHQELLRLSCEAQTPSLASRLACSSCP